MDLDAVFAGDADPRDRAFSEWHGKCLEWFDATVLLDGFDDLAVLADVDAWLRNDADLRNDQRCSEAEYYEAYECLPEIPQSKPGLQLQTICADNAVTMYVLGGCSLFSVGSMAKSCKHFRSSTAVCALLETKAREYLDKHCSVKKHFLHAFSGLDWAITLPQTFSDEALHAACDDSLSAMFKHQMRHRCICNGSVDTLVGLHPLAGMQWRKEGLQSFKKFFRNCVLEKHTYRKLLKHCMQDWLSIQKILTINAGILLFSQWTVHQVCDWLWEKVGL